MDWLPNEDAIRYFMREIMPLIKKKVPDASLTVVGRNPPSSLVDLSREDSSLVITGRVDDVRPYIERAATYVVPLRIGGGTRLKIFEAMAMECPVVSTAVGAEGLPVEDGRHLRLADSADDFARATAELLMQKDLATALAASAAALVRGSYAWPRVAERFAELCAPAARVHPSLSTSGSA
jgi:glycosyltransferase involved in cell wall biosynthesis